MATPEQTQAPVAPYRPSAAATMDAAQTSASAAAHAAVPGTLLVTGVQARAIAEATEQIVGALRQFARGRQATIVPMLQRQLTETFVQRTPEEIAKHLGKEAMRERQFLKRQQVRINRDLPKVLAEADVAKRRQAMGKLLDREKRYMGQRERAMAARAHAVVESLDIQDASPEGAYWKLGYAKAHTPGCVAMSGKFWPWSVLREVGIPPIHPACACELLPLHEAVGSGLMKPDAIPDAKDAMLRARRNMALEEAVYDAWPEEYLLVDLEEARHHHGGDQQRYPKGTELGGAFMPRVGADLRKAKGALGELLTQRGDHREVWLHGNRLKIPRERNFQRKISGHVYYSPPGSTNVYRGQTLVDQEGVGPLDDAAKPPAPGRAGAALDLSGTTGLPGSDEPAKQQAIAKAKSALAGQGAPVKVGHEAKATHEGLLAAGFEMRDSKMRGKGTMRIAYRSEDGRDLSVDYDRRSGRVTSLHWPSGEKKQPVTKYHGPQTTAPAPSRSDNPGKWADWKPKKLFGDSEGKSWEMAPPPKPVVHEPLRDSAAEQGDIPDYDHVKIEVSGSKWQKGPRRAVGPDGEKYELKDYDGDADRVASELLANAVYRRMGANVPAAGVRHFGYVPDFASIPDVDLKEPPISSTMGRRISSGIIIRDAEGNVTLFEPKNHFGGYEHTFPKGGVEPGLTPQQNAHKELWEETGLHARITGVLGDYEGDTGISRYYMGVLTGGEPTPGDETEAVKTVSPTEAAELLNKERDKTILADLLQRPAYLGDPGPDEFPAEVLGPPAVLSPLVNGKSKSITEPSGPLGAHYMTDALLGNWDFAGSKSLIWGEDGSPIRVDHSSALAMSGKGGRKPFGPVPTEVWSLASPKGQGFGKVKVTPAQKRRQAAEIEKRLTPAAIDELVDEAPFADPELREETRQALKARVAWMGRYAAGKEVDPVPSTGKEAASELKANQAHLRLFPEQAEALDLYGPEVNETIMADTPKGQADPDVRFAIEELDTLLRDARHAAPLTDDVTAFAGLDAEALPTPEELVGKTVTHRGFLEMGLDEAEARKGKMVMQVLVPAGANALYTRGIRDFKAGKHLPDLLAPRRSRLRVVRVVKRQGKTYVEAVLET